MWCRDLSCTTLIIRSFFAALIALVLQKCIQMKIFCCFNLWAGKNCMSKALYCLPTAAFICGNRWIIASRPQYSPLSHITRTNARLESLQLRGSLFAQRIKSSHSWIFYSVPASGAACLLLQRDAVNQGQMKRWRDASRPKKWEKLTEHETILFIFTRAASSLIYSAPAPTREILLCR